MNQGDTAVESTPVVDGFGPQAPPPTRKPPRPIAERRFYSGMALIMVLIVLIGFGPTFYLKPFGVPQYPRPAPELTPGLMIHGFTFGLWVLLFVAQTWLVAAGRRDLHRSLGIASFGFAVALIPIMYLNAAWQVGRSSAPPFTDALTWTVVPLAAIPALVAMGWMGWQARRRDLQAHKRFMLGLMIMLMEPAISRFPIAPPTLAGFTALGILAWLLFGAMFLWDRRQIGRVHQATKIGALLFAIVIVVQVGFLAAPGPWARFAAILPGVGS